MKSRTVTREDLCRRLAVNVRSARNAAGLTLKGASERVEMHWRHWQKVEAGKNNTTLATIVRMAAALNVTPAELLAEPPPGAEEPGGA